MKSVIKTAKTVEEAVEVGLKELSASRDEATIEVLEEPSRGLFGLIGSKDAVVRIAVEDNVKEEILRDLRLPYVSRDESPERMRPAKKEREEKEVRLEQKPEKKKEVQPEREKPVPKPAPVPVEEKEPVPSTEPVAEKKKEAAAPVKKEREPRRPVGQAKPVRLDVEEEVVELQAADEPSAKLLAQMLEAMDLNATITAKQQGQILHLYVSGVPDDKAGLVIGRRGETLDAMQYLITLASHNKETGYRKVVVDINDYRKKRDDALRQLAVRSAEKVLKSNRNMRLEPMNPYERRIIHSELQKMDGVHTVSEGQEPYRRIVIRINRNR